MSLAEPTAEVVWNDFTQTDHHARSISICHSGYYFLRNLLEPALGLILLALSAPLLALLVLAIRMTSSGPAIYRQRRVGLGGRIFTMYKLRSMRCDAESGSGPVWAGVLRDPRVTPLGSWLRHLHLDELPQLYNVVRGEMSLVGPRPERPEFVSLLSDQIPGYLDRLAVKPGITGLAQINLPPDTNLQSVQRKLELDREYIHSAGLLLDARLVLCTALRLLGLRGGRAVSLLGLHRDVILSEQGDSVPGTSPPVVGDLAFGSVEPVGNLKSASPGSLVAARS